MINGIVASSSPPNVNTDMVLDNAVSNDRSAFVLSIPMVMVMIGTTDVIKHSTPIILICFRYTMSELSSMLLSISSPYGP